MSPAPPATSFQNSGMKRYSQFSKLIFLRNAKEGIAAVEFALSASFLVPLFFGAVSLGLAAWTKMQVGNAARAGAVYASNHGYDAANIKIAAQSATALSTSILVISPLQISQSCIDQASGQISSAGSATACPSTGSPPGTYVTVNTQYSYTFILPLPGIANAVTLSGKAIVRIK